MKLSATKQLLDLYKEQSALEDYQSGVPRWCTGCGDNAILTAVPVTETSIMPLVSPSTS